MRNGEKREDEADRQVDLAADQQEHHADGDDRPRARASCEMLTMLSLVRNGRGRGEEPEVDDQQDDDHQDRRLALLGEQQPRPV